MTGRTVRAGFTLIEAVIVVVVIAVLLAFLTPVMRERERARLQAVADTEPSAVFTMECQPASDPLQSGEGLDFVCSITNTKGYDLAFKQHVVLRSFRAGDPGIGRAIFDPPTDPDGGPLIVKSKETVDIRFRKGLQLQPGEYTEAFMEADILTFVTSSTSSDVRPVKEWRERQPLESNRFSFRIVGDPIEYPKLGSGLGGTRGP